MKFLDLLRSIFGNLNRRKGRVALTAIGVIIGTAAVVILVSLAIGLQQNANRQLYGIGDLTQIQVMPSYGSDIGIEVPVGGGGGGGPGGQPVQKLLTNKALAELAAIPGVSAVVPRDYLYAGSIIRAGRLEGGASTFGVGVDDLSVLGLSAQEGSLVLERGTAVIGVMVANNFYDPRARPGQEQPPPPELIDQQLKMILLKWDETQGIEIRKSVPLKIVGVVAETRGEADWTMYMRLEDVKAFNEWAMGRRVNYEKEGYAQVIVKVAEVDQVLDVAQQITDLGYVAYTPASYVEGINNFYLVLQVIFGGVGAIALLVAAIGIANTMAMSILERTREIGLMKAIGATNRDVLSIFLGEAAGIGFLGGLGGVVSGWLAGQIINVLALVYFAGQASQQGGPPPSIAVYTPVWLLAFALIFATVVGLLSGLYPALRAATMVPVTALKYE